MSGTPPLDGRSPDVVELYQRLADLIQRCGDVVVAPTKTRVLFKVRTVFASVAVGKNGLDVALVMAGRLKHRRIRKAQEEYPGVVHSLRTTSLQMRIWLVGCKKPMTTANGRTRDGMSRKCNPAV